MKNYNLLLFGLLTLSCNERTNTTAAVQETICFLAGAEAKNRDTIAASLTIDGEKVTGKLLYAYYQKDGRFGKIEGTKNGDIISGIWRYEQEGMKDSVEVGFKLSGNTLQQKALAFDEKTGREYLPADAPYTITYEKIDCGMLPVLDKIH